MNSELEKFYDHINDIGIAMLTTRRSDGHLQSRAMATQKRAAGADLWFVALDGSPKMHDIEHDPHVNLSYYKDRTREWISVSGLTKVSRDREKIRELYSPDVEIWHNVTGKVQTRDENLALLRYFTGRVSERRYEVLAREFFEGGFVQRHILHGKLASGERIAAPVCIVVHVSRGKIDRLFEYLDFSAVRGAFA